MTGRHRNVLIAKIRIGDGVGSWDISEEGEHFMFSSCLEAPSALLETDSENAQKGWKESLAV